MPFKSVMNLRFPAGGLVERYAYQDQPPYTTPACLNVRPDCAVEARQRGGSRPGLGKVFTTISGNGEGDGGPIGDGSPVRMLASMGVVPSSGFTYWHEGFPYSTFDTSPPYGFGQLTKAPWKRALWLDSLYTPKYWNPGYAAVTYGLSGDYGCGAVRDDLEIDTSKSYSVAMFIKPFNGAHYGHYRIHLMLDNINSPNANANGVEAVLNLCYRAPNMENLAPNPTGNYSVHLSEHRNWVHIDHGSAAQYLPTGFADAGWFEVVVQPVANTNAVRCYWQGRQVLWANIPAFPGRRVGFSIAYGQAYGEGRNGMCWVDAMRIEYCQPIVLRLEQPQELLVASAAGKLYREVSLGRVKEVATTTRLADDRLIHAVDRLQKLYIADNGAKIQGKDGMMSHDANHPGAYALTSEYVLEQGGWIALGVVPGDHVVINETIGVMPSGTWVITEVLTNWIMFADDNPIVGNSNCNFSVDQRLPKVYDPLLGTLEIWETDSDDTNPENVVPPGCPLIARYRDRMVLAAAPVAPHAWYMSAQGNPNNWDYSKYIVGDFGTAVAGQACDAGDIGAPITALIPHSDDYLIFGCAESMWKLVGDPAMGGMIDSVSRSVGVVGSGAYCWGPAGELVFLSRDGLYGLAPGAQGFPQSLSRERIPRQLIGVDVTNHIVLMAYDVRYRGVHVYLTSKTEGSTQHFWFDWETKSFWPTALQIAHEPTAILNYIGGTVNESGVLLGGRDGYIRRYSDAYAHDDGTAIDSYVYLGPLRLSAGESQDGMFTEINGAPAQGSGKVKWELLAGETAEAAFTADPTDSGVWQPGLNYAARPRARGSSAFVKLSTGQDNAAWAIERITARRRQAGKQRLL